MTAQELKNSILQLAVQGKLVPQNSNDTIIDLTGLKLKKTDEYEFEVPSCWKLAHLESVTISIPTKQYQILESEVRKSGKYSVVSQSKAGFIGFTDDERKLYKHEKPVVIFGDHTTEIKYIDFDFVVGADGVKIFEPINNIIYAKFLFYVLQLYSKDLSKLGGYTRHYKYIKNKPIPLPPLAEQKRIVEKIEELMPLIEEYGKAEEQLSKLNAEFPDKLRKSILQQAVQGKLTERDPADEPASELLKRIKTEKEALIKSGKIKKEKPLPAITDDEKPFDIPDVWEWVKIGELFQHNTGKALNSLAMSGNPYEYITTSNVYWGRFELEKLRTMLFTKAELDKCTVQKGDLLVLEGGDCGRAAIWNYDFPIRIQNHIHRLRPYVEICVEFFYYVFYLYKNVGIISGKGIGIQGLSSNALHSLIVPLPPLTEQKRIVKRVEELLALCDELK